MSLSRKSPVEHKVRQHRKRNGTVVSQYKRGKGKPKKEKFTPKRIGSVDLSGYVATADGRLMPRSYGTIGAAIDAATGPDVTVIEVRKR